MTALERLRLVVGESKCESDLTDEQLETLLDECGGDVAVAAYQALLYKSRNTGLTLASGLRLPDQSGHYRRLARLYRPQGRGMLARADEPFYTTKGVSKE